METNILFNLGGLPVSDTLFFTWVIMVILSIGSFLLTRNLKKIPSGTQHLLEVVIDTLEKMVFQDMGRRGKAYVPLIIAIFLFILLSNLISIFPGATSPTADLSTTLALAVIVFFVAHASEIKIKGLWTYIKDWFSPYWFLFPLNLAGEVSKILSHSFRLYGNIFGGGIILGIVYGFFPYIVPVPLLAWFGVFMGLLQAAVFTLLAIVYIQVRIE